MDASLETDDAEAYLTSAAPAIEKEQSVLPTLDTESEESHELTELENQAHSQKVLLSSDAMRYFTAKVALLEDRTATLDRVIAKARVSYPSEDGWVVLNLIRMEQLMEEVDAERNARVVEEKINLDTGAPFPTTSGSLAEAIVTGNIVAAYEMISHRPMIALADATADLDALYRLRNGEQVEISEMLKTESLKLSSEQLQNAIGALTSALDGTYTDEASAVKMAIMKAVKALSQQ